MKNCKQCNEEITYNAGLIHVDSMQVVGPFCYSCYKKLLSTGEYVSLNFGGNYESQKA